jgi:OOP family OmpA-OmpF porin
MKKYSLLLLLAVSATFASAQDGTLSEAHVSNYKDWAIGVNIGDIFVAGDHSSYDADNGFDFNLGLNLHATKYLNSVLGVKGNLTLALGPINASNGASTVEISPYIDGSIMAVGNVSALGMRGRSFDRKQALLVGAGLGLSTSQAEVNGFDGNIQEWGADGGTLEAFIIGEGVYKWSLNSTWDLDLGVNVRFNLGDAVDGFKGAFTTNGNDIILYPHVGVSYNFGNGKTEESSVIYINPLDDMYSAVEEVKNNFDKLTTDDDNDGVNNLFDKENNTPEGATVDGSGKASDVDQDGIPDYMDEDPFTSKGAKVNANGRAIDSDNDGVADYMDKEPNTPAGTLVNFKGQTLPKGSSGGGNGFMPSVFFSFNSASVTAANQERMATIALALKNNPDLKVTVVGHADNRGSEEYNKNLSMRRAQAVVKKLVQVYGVNESRLTAEASGENDPLAKGNYSVNRRADIVIK